MGDKINPENKIRIDNIAIQEMMSMALEEVLKNFKASGGIQKYVKNQFDQNLQHAVYALMGLRSDGFREFSVIQGGRLMDLVIEEGDPIIRKLVASAFKKIDYDKLEAKVINEISRSFEHYLYQAVDKEMKEKLKRAAEETAHWVMGSDVVADAMTAEDLLNEPGGEEALRDRIRERVLAGRRMW